MKKLLLTLLLAASTSSAQSFYTTSVTLGWTYNFGSEVFCSQTIQGLCDQQWEYGYVTSGPTFNSLGSVGLPTYPYQTMSVNSITTGNPTTLTINIPSVGSFMGLGTFDSYAVVSGASGSGCSVLNGNWILTVIDAYDATIAVNSSGCTYTPNSASVQIGYTTTFLTTLSGSITFAVRMTGLDGGGNLQQGSFLSSEITTTLPTPATPTAFSSANPGVIIVAHTP